MKKLTKNLLSLMLACLLFVGGIQFSANSKAEASGIEEEKIYCTATIDDSFAGDKVMVVLNESASKSSKIYSEADFISYGCIDVKDLTEVATEAVQGEENEAVNIESYRRVLSLTLNENSKENVLQVVNGLIEREDVLYAGPDYVLTKSAITPNDTYVANQWAINKMDLKSCWEVTQGSADVIVGVLDTGIDGSHPDLSSSIINNLCRDFTNGEEVAVGSPTDTDGHGTHVAGIIGAKGNNNLGIAGVNWNVKLASLKVFDDGGNTYASHVGQAIDYAERVGIKILNFSGGWDENDSANDDALDAVIETYSGLLVCAAGNGGIDQLGDNNDTSPQYPASYTEPNIISVGAVDTEDNRCNFSNYGEIAVDIFAPGNEILSTFSCEICDRDVVFYDGTRFCELSHYYRSLIEEDIKNGVYTWDDIEEDFFIEFNAIPYQNKQSTHKVDGYHYMSGTSMAAPYVTGVAALLLSIHPDLTAEQLKDIIMVSARIPVDVNGNRKLAGMCVSEGIVNAYNAVDYLLNNYRDSVNLNGSDVSITRIINSSETVYNERAVMIKLNAQTISKCRITVSSTQAISIKIYYATMQENISISPMYSNNNKSVTYSSDLPANGVQYLEIKFESATVSGAVNVDIHLHDYTHDYQKYTDSQHKSYCECGAYILGTHTVKLTDTGRYKPCIACGYLVDTGIGGGIGGVIHPGSVSQLVTVNGSYVLPNGVIALVDEDIEAYFAGTLKFYKKDELPEIF